MVIIYILGAIIMVGVESIIYAILLWIICRIQKLQYTLPGLLFASVIAAMVRLIPFAGPWLAYAVLLVILSKVTHSAMFPDCAFTAIISNSLMFVVELWVIGAVTGMVLGDKSAYAREKDKSDPALEWATQAQESPPPPRYKPIATHPSGLALKGVSLQASDPLAMFASPDGIHSLGVGETIDIRNENGRRSIKCEEITSTHVRLLIDGAERVEFQVQ